MSSSNLDILNARSHGAVLLATLNENDSIRPVLEEVVESIRNLRQFGHELSILVVDDSQDSTLQEIVERCGKEWGVSVHYVRGPQRGLGAALSEGLEFAVRDLNCDFVVNLDADGQHDARQIPDLLRAHLSSGASITIGSRWTRGGKCYGLSLPRKLVSRLSSLALRATSIPWHVKDPTTSFRIYSRECVTRCVRETLGFSGFSFFGCIVAVADAQTQKVIEVPIHFRPRFAGKSNLKFGQMKRAVRDLPRIRSTAKMVARRQRGGVASAEGQPYPAGTVLEHLSNNEKTAIRWFNRFRFAIGDKVLEVGAGTGHNTEILARHATSVTALEPDPSLFDIAQRNCAGLSNVQFLCSTLRDHVHSGHDAGGVTSVVYVNVLEHIENDLDELRLAYKLLSSGGHVVVFSPARPSYYGTLDQSSLHFRRYSSREAEALLSTAGFELVRLEQHDPLGGVLYFILYRVLRVKSAGRTSVFAYDNIVLPVSQLVARMTKYRLAGKNILFIGRKP